MSAPAETHTCIHCGREGAKGFTEMYPQGSDRWACEASEACARRMRRLPLVPTGVCPVCSFRKPLTGLSVKRMRSHGNGEGMPYRRCEGTNKPPRAGSIQ